MKHASTLVATLVLALSSLALLAAPAAAARSREPFSRTAAEIALHANAARTAAPAHVMTGHPLVAVNQAWIGTSGGTTVLVGSHSFTFGTDAFAKIQAGVDAVDAGGTVWVLPGTYLETAPGSYLYDASGPYQFGLFFGVGKPGLTVEGVDASGIPIASAAAVATTINYDANNTFGTSGIFVEADHITLQGLGIGSQMDPMLTNKTIEVIGDDFTFRNCTLNDHSTDGVYLYTGDIYINDWRATMSTSYVQSYHILNSIFADGNTIDIASGAGISGSAVNRELVGNAFTMSDIYNSISFNGSGGQPWYVYPVGGATITGNTFTNTNAAGTIIKARGTYDNSQFDWAAYWSGNSFNRATCEGIAPPGNLRAYSYSVYTNARRIEATIQGEVDNAVSGDVVLVHGGAYAEQVVVNGKSVTVQGAGRAATTIQSPAVLATSFNTGSVKKPVVLCENAANVAVRDLTIDGMGAGNANNSFEGVAFWNAGGQLLNCDVTRVRDTPFSGAQHGVSVYAYNNTGGPYALEVGGVHITDLQKNGMALSGAGLTVNVHDCVVTGQGPTGVTAENGIQVSYGAGGAISNCAVSGIYYTTGGTVACGLLLYQATTVNVTGGSVTGCQDGVLYQDAAGTITGTSISTPAYAGDAPYGIGLYNTASTAPQTTARPTGVSGVHGPRPIEPVTETEASFAAKPASVTSAPLAFTIANGCMTGSGLSGSEGIDIWSAGAGLQVGITGMEISGWDWGIGTSGSGFSVDANHNKIVGNLTAGYDFVGAGPATNLATLNWWGNAGGPGVGGANPVVGTGVVSSPFLTTGTDLNPGCGFTAGADNVVAAGPAPSCISQTNTCIVIPVGVARTTSDNVRGFSVTFHLSANLQLCSGTASVTEGTYLGGFTGGTAFEAVDNHDGTYTADCAILGGACGATAATGTLFNMSVKRVATDGNGTITIDRVVMRDCDNGPVAASAGAPLSITIDTGSPLAIANLVAAQKKSGNDADGTTKIVLTFTPPGDATAIEVYRAGFGHYPEYDDAGGTVPVAPPSHAALGGWTLTGVTASGMYDEPSTRDFYYYVAFSKDLCGNFSAVSNMTGGTLNYHLGDVVDPAHPLAVGDNAVDGSDISRLGGHYGITLPLNDTYNYLDVGPTTNYSVNARPTTDSKVNFEDLIMFAINYTTVSAPQFAAQPLAAGRNALALSVPVLPAVGETFAVPVNMDGAGTVQGASVRLSWDAAVVEPVGVEAGGLLQGQRFASVVLSPQPGTVDFALLGDGAAISGSGEAARVIFRVKAAGSPAIAIGDVVARDSQNQPVSLEQQPASGPGAAPAKTELGSAYPNPFGHTASLRLSLAREGAVKVVLYDLAGRRVRTIMDSVQPAGTRILTWDGLNDAGLRMAPGVYVMRLQAGGVMQSRRLQFVP